MTESEGGKFKLGFVGMPPPCEVSGCEEPGTRSLTTRTGSVELVNLCLAHLRIVLAWRRKNEDVFELFLRQAHDDLLTFLETGEFPPGTIYRVGEGNPV